MLLFCYNAIGFECFVKNKKILSQKNVNKKFVRRKKRNRKQLLFCQNENNFCLNKNVNKESVTQMRGEINTKTTL